MIKKLKPISMEELEKAEQSALEKFDPSFQYYAYERKGQIRKNGMVVQWEKRVKYGKVEVDTYSSDYDINKKGCSFWDDLMDEVKRKLSDEQWRKIDRADKRGRKSPITYTYSECTRTHAHIENIPKDKIDYVIDKILYVLFKPDKGYLEPAKCR